MANVTRVERMHMDATALRKFLAIICLSSIPSPAAHAAS